nr:MAG TPA: hypothetical protein [Caudoviricetes sp.]
MYVYILIFYILRFCMLFDNNTRSEALLRIKTRIPVLEGRNHEKRRTKSYGINR